MTINKKYAVTIILLNLLFAQPPNIQDDFDELEGKLSIYFFNALNGKPVKGAKVTMEDVGTFETDTKGKIQFEIPLDPFAKIPVSIRKSGYTDTDFLLEMKAGTIFLNRFSLSPVLPLKHVRLVLDWGKKPRDLDAHLIKKNRNSYHISYRHKRKAADGVAMLDRDDINGEGPETITVTSLDYNGEYEYNIEDYTNRMRKTSDKLSNSHAEVKVYGKGKLLHHFKVPENSKGNIWKVIKIKKNEIIPVNSLRTN